MSLSRSNRELDGWGRGGDAGKGKGRKDNAKTDRKGESKDVD